MHIAVTEGRGRHAQRSCRRIRHRWPATKLVVRGMGETWAIDEKAWVSPCSIFNWCAGHQSSCPVGLRLSFSPHSVFNPHGQTTDHVECVTLGFFGQLVEVIQEFLLESVLFRMRKP